MDATASERGSGTVLAVALIGCIVMLTLSALPLYAVLAERRRVATVADAAALAAADAASGLVPGDPCVVAARVATANAAELTGCDVDGLVVTVETTTRGAGLVVAEAATAGPP